MNHSLVFVLFATLIFSACAPASIPTPAPSATLLPTIAPSATPSPTPTATPTATPTPLPTLPPEQLGELTGVPDPRATNPELFDLKRTDSPIVQFAKAFGIRPEEVGDLTPRLLTGADGKPFVVLITGDLPQAANFDETGTPFLIAEQKENGEWRWGEATPATLYTINDQVLEVAVSSYRQDENGQWLFLLKRNSPYAKLVIESGNRIVVSGEMNVNWVFSNFDKKDWDRILSNWDNIKLQLDNNKLPTGFNYNWNAAEDLINFASQNGLQIRVQHLAWDPDVPSDFNSYSRDELVKLIEFIVKTRIIKFGDQVSAWDLPDEPVERSLYNQGLWTGKKLEALETVKLTAQFVREVDPNARLILVDDFVLEGFPSENFDQKYFAFVDSLIQQGVDIDALSFENNFWIFDSIDESRILRVFQEVKRRGLTVEGGETTIAISPLYPNWPSRPKVDNISDKNLLITQARMYSQLVKLYLQNGISSFGLGNLEDEFSWQARVGYLDSKSSLVADASGAKKPAWYAFMAAYLESFK